MGKWTDLPKKPKNSKISTPPYQAKEGEGGGGGSHDVGVIQTYFKFTLRG